MQKPGVLDEKCGPHGQEIDTIQTWEIFIERESLLQRDGGVRSQEEGGPGWDRKHDPRTSYTNRGEKIGLIKREE